ncbi:MAG: hypothetical protein ACLPRE_10925, partial [Limisphaerales bacterium]
YGIRPLRTNDALVAWTNALQVAHDDIEREGVYIHLARIKMLAGRYAEARAQLDGVTNTTYASLKQTLERAVTQRESEATNSIGDGDSTNVPTNNFMAPTNTLTVITNITTSPTNSLPLLTNGVPVLTNPPVFSPKIVNIMTNVPPNPPKAFHLSQS